MPTLECLDERSKAILDRLEQIDEKFSENFRDFRSTIEERNKIIDRRIDAVEADMLALKIQRAEEGGKRSMLVWMGGIALTAFASIFGAIGNAVYSWVIRTH